MKSYAPFAVGGLLLLFVLQVPACSILSPVGDVISGGYENTVAYFNAYYNASRAFSEAEAEILTAERLSRGKVQSASNALVVPSAAKTKLTTAIDKCSNILAFHSSSALVDDALLIIGKSFFYTGDYIKAERKFSELISRFPTSDLQLEAQYWYARCQERLGKFEAAHSACDALIEAARAEEQEEIEYQARIVKANVFKRQEQFDPAAEELTAALALPIDDQQRTETRIALADVHFAAKRYERAATQYLEAAEETDDPFEGYYSTVQAAIAARSSGNNVQSRQLLEDAAIDFRFKEWLPAIKYELGRTLAASGSTDDAINAYVFVDTSQVRTDYSPRAAFELAAIYESKFLDYVEANRYYNRASSVVDPVTNAKAKLKANAFRRYFDTHKRLHDLDSTWTAEQDTLYKLAKDTVIATLPDSLRPKPYMAVLNADTVRRTRAVFQQELGDLFYAELEIPDSAVFYYMVSMRGWADSVRTPRMFYILAEIARSNPDRGFPPSSHYDSLLVASYPRSEYARAVMSRHRSEAEQSMADPASQLYRNAEASIDSGYAESALTTLQSIVAKYPASPIAAKSAFAIAWLYENKLGLPDSALAQYRRVSAAYEKTPFASAASRRFLPIKLIPDSTRADTSRGDTARLPADSSAAPKRFAPTAPATPAQKPAVPKDRAPAEELK